MIWFGADFFAREVFFMPYRGLRPADLGAYGMDHGVSGRASRLFPGPGNHRSPTAASQIFEQIVNAVVSVAAGSVLFNER